MNVTKGFINVVAPDDGFLNLISLSLSLSLFQSLITSHFYQIFLWCHSSFAIRNLVYFFFPNVYLIARSLLGMRCVYLTLSKFYSSLSYLFFLISRGMFFEIALLDSKIFFLFWIATPDVTVDLPNFQARMLGKTFPPVLRITSSNYHFNKTSNFKPEGKKNFFFLTVLLRRLQAGRMSIVRSFDHLKWKNYANRAKERERERRKEWERNQRGGICLI